MPHDNAWIAPRMCEGFPGVGGVLKSRPEDFVVEEIPAYLPCGEGEHVYVRVRKRELTTFAVSRMLQDAFGVKERDVGFAGMKDRWAVTTQWMSVYFPGREVTPETRASLEAQTGIEVLDWSRHRNKLRRGHLKGNRFELRIADARRVDGLSEAIARLREQGFYNLYGAQRLGRDGETVRQGRRLLSAKRRVKGRKALLTINAVQSWWFNQSVGLRASKWGVHTVRVGDVLQLGTGPTFVCEDAEVDQPREDAREVVVTGPLFGPRMRRAEGEPGALEEELLGMGADELMGQRIRGAEGGRRAMISYPRELVAEYEKDAVRVSVELDPGVYVTELMRELMGEAEQEE